MQTKPRRYYRQHEFLQQTLSGNSICTDIKPLFFLLKAFGLMPIYEVISRYEIGPPIKRNEFYSFFIRSVVGAVIGFNLYKLLNPGSSKMLSSDSETDDVTYWIEFLLCDANFSIMVLLCIKKGKSSMKIINDILQVDEAISRQCGVTLSNDCAFVLKYFFVVYALELYSLILYARYLNPSVTSILYWAFHILQLALTTTFIVYISALLRIVTVRFAFLNSILNGYSYKNQRRMESFQARRIDEVVSMENFPEDSAFSFRQHNKLLVIYKSINDFCSFFLVSYTGYTFYTITDTVYILFVEITTEPQISLTVIQSDLTWLMTHTALLALLSKSCAQVTKEAKLTSQMVARVYSKCKEIRNIVDKFLTKSIKQKIEFTAYGFFGIDNSTFFKMFSAVTTYLVILIQFKQLEDSKLQQGRIHSAKN